MTRVALSLVPDRLAAYSAAQIRNLFPDGSSPVVDDLMPAVPGALSRLEHCFSHIDIKYYFDGAQVRFNHLNGDQYAAWLYLLANELHRLGADSSLCTRLYLLNKALHGVEIYHEVQLPSVFCLVHPIGTVLGRARYEDFLLVYQRCGVGSNHDIYPTLGRHLTLRPGASVLGCGTVADRCTVAAESLVLDTDIPVDSLYIGDPRNHIIRPYGRVPRIWRNR